MSSLNEFPYRALLEGLETAVIPLSQVLNGARTLRLDSNITNANIY